MWPSFLVNPLETHRNSLDLARPNSWACIYKVNQLRIMRNHQRKGISSLFFSGWTTTTRKWLALSAKMESAKAISHLCTRLKMLGQSQPPQGIIPLWFGEMNGRSRDPAIPPRPKPERIAPQRRPDVKMISTLSLETPLIQILYSCIDPRIFESRRLIPLIVWFSFVVLVVCLLPSRLVFLFCWGLLLVWIATRDRNACGEALGWFRNVPSHFQLDVPHQRRNQKWPKCQHAK